MKKLIYLLFIFISSYCFGQKIQYLTFNQNYNYRNKPLAIIETYWDVTDLNGKIIKQDKPSSSYTWIDWNNKIVKSIRYNKLQQPFEYEESYYNNEGLIIKYIFKDYDEERNCSFEYSSDFSNYTVYLNTDSKKEKIRYGEYVKENNAYVYYECEYEDDNVTNAYKITGPGLSGDVRNFSINTDKENPLYNYDYEDNELRWITTIYGTDYDLYETLYSMDDSPTFCHTVFDDNKNPIYYKIEYKSDSDEWKQEYKIKYEFDDYGNTISDIFYNINNDFGIECLEPQSLTEYAYYYKYNKEIFEPSMPKVLYKDSEEQEYTNSDKGGELTLEEGKFKIAMEVGYPPFEYYDEDEKTIIGFDVELGKEIAKRLGLEAVFIDTAWDNIFTGLNADKYDAIISAITITEARLENFLISNPYIGNGQVIIVRNHSPYNIAKISDLEGLRVGYQTDTIAEFYMKKMSEIQNIKYLEKPYDKITNAFDDLKLKKIDAVVCDSLVAVDYLASSNSVFKQAFADKTDEYFGVFVKKGNDDLLLEINKVIDDMKKDGSLKNLYIKIFGIDLSDSIK